MYIHTSVQNNRRQLEVRTRQFDKNGECDWVFVAFCLNLRNCIGYFKLIGWESEGAHMLKSLKWWTKDLTPSTRNFFDEA
jgi:hypothetical protein